MIASLMRRLCEGGEYLTFAGGSPLLPAEAQLDRLLRLQVLRERAPSTSWSACAHCACGLRARQIEEIDGQLLAICPFDRAEDEVVEPHELRRFQVSPPALLRELATAVKLRGEPARVADGLWHIGTAPSARSIFLVFGRSTLLAPTLLAVLRHVAGPGPVTLIGPEPPADALTRLRDGGIRFVAISQAVVAAPTILGVALDLGVIEDAAPAPRLRLRSAAGEAALDGASAVLPTQPFRLLLAFAEAATAGRPVLTQHEIDKATGREARDMIRDLRNGLAKIGGASARDLIMTRQGRGWEIILRPGDIVIEP